LAKKNGQIAYYKNTGNANAYQFQLFNDTLGNIDISGTNPDGYTLPHFMKIQDSIYLFIGSIGGKLQYFNHIKNHLSVGQSFHLENPNLLNVDAEGYSSFFVTQIDNDAFLDLFIGNDLGGLYRYEVDPNSTASLDELPKKDKYFLVPNPADQQIFIQGIIGEFEISILDFNGKTQYSGKIIENQAINIQTLKAGYYFIHIKNEVQNSVLPFVKL